MSRRSAELDEEYVQARRVLLDALEALEEQRRSVIVAGAQAIYLRTGPGSLPVADFTTDGDIALDPEQLADDPTIVALMQAGGFELKRFRGAEEPGIWEAPAVVNGKEVPGRRRCSSPRHTRSGTVWGKIGRTVSTTRTPPMSSV